MPIPLEVHYLWEAVGNSRTRAADRRWSGVGWVVGGQMVRNNEGAPAPRTTESPPIPQP